jgi:structural maintenance of chromosome 1
MLLDVRGRVVDLCKPTQRKYETAASIILGCNIDAAVVDEEITAIECIKVCSFSYLPSLHGPSLSATIVYAQSTSRSGHPLDARKVKLINDKFCSFAKGARLVVDVIQFEPVVERAMHYACGNAFVCNKVEVVKFVTWEKGQGVKG